MLWNADPHGCRSLNQRNQLIWMGAVWISQPCDICTFLTMLQQISKQMFGKNINENIKQHYVTLTHCFEKRNLTMHINTSHKTAILVKSGHILQTKCLLVFPLMFDDCSVCLQPFILAKLSPATTRCCSCSFVLQAACVLLSETSMNHRVEAEQS